jgi:hypothetical protein
LKIRIVLVTGWVYSLIKIKQLHWVWKYAWNNVTKFHVCGGVQRQSWSGKVARSYCTLLMQSLQYFLWKIQQREVYLRDFTWFEHKVRRHCFGQTLTLHLAMDKIVQVVHAHISKVNAVISLRINEKPVARAINFNSTFTFRKTQSHQIML